MSSKKYKPIHKKGGIREMMFIALPMVVSNACYTMMTFTDRMFLAHLKPELMSAAMGGGLTTFMMMTFFLGVTGYATALVAQHLGAGRTDRCAVIMTQTFIIAFLAYPIILSCRPLAHGLFDVVGITPSQIKPQKEYFDILLYAVIISLLRNCLSAFFSGIGHTGMVMISSFSAMVINIVVNYILIFGKFGVPALGIRGAAYGTILGGGIGFLILLFAYVNKNNRKKYGVFKSLRFDWSAMKMLFSFGYPAGLEMFLNLLAFDLIIMIFHSMGAVASIASTILFNWEMVSFVPLLGIQIGVTSLVGRYMGARLPDTAHRATMSGLKIGFVYSFIIFILFSCFSSTLVNLFRPDGVDSLFIQAKPIAVFMIRAVSLYVMLEAMMLCFMGALRGAGDTFWAMFISVTLHWVLVIVLFLSLKVFGMSLQISWSVMIGIFSIFSFIFYLRYSGGKWREISIVSDKPFSPVAVRDDFHELSDL